MYPSSSLLPLKLCRSNGQQPGGVIETYTHCAAIECLRVHRRVQGTISYVFIVVSHKPINGSLSIYVEIGVTTQRLSSVKIRKQPVLQQLSYIRHIHTYSPEYIG